VSDPPYNPYVGIDVCKARLDVAGKRKKLALIGLRASCSRSRHGAHVLCSVAFAPSSGPLTLDTVVFLPYRPASLSACRGTAPTLLPAHEKQVQER
jgi:hypothetical protein